jgi:uncharacterized protein YkwD
MLAITVALLLQAQTTPYLVLPRTRPELRSSASSSAVSPLDAIRMDVLTLINKERAARKLTPLKRSSLLEGTAQAHADDMLRRKFFSHTSPDGKTPEKRMQAAGYNGVLFGENVAKGQRTAADVMKSWMASSMHRANILKPDFRDVGIGYAGGLWVQNFGSVQPPAK